MMDERERVGRVLRGFAPPDDSFERLNSRRERKHRNRRIRAGALGAIVALAMGLAFVRSLASDGVPADQPERRPVPAAPASLAYALDGDVYVADPDGSNAVKIADGLSAEDCYGWGGEYWAEGPMWSPDGRYLAYRRHTDCGGDENTSPQDVVISDAEGNVVTSFPADGWDIGWSPDSTRVAVWDVVFETIGVYGLDGARQAQLTMPAEHGGSGDWDPVWMPDGTSLMVPNGSRIELPLDGGAPRPLPFPGYASAFSPDGSHVVYGTRRSLMVARSDGSDTREVFGDWGGTPTWSPTGDRIAFTTSGPGRAWWSAELRVLDVATGSVTKLLEGERGPALSVIGFSPKGDRILFSSADYRGAGEFSLWSIGVDGSDARLVVAGTSQGDWFSR